MIRILVVSLVVFTGGAKCNAQVLTYGEVYDYQVGDEFAIESKIQATAPYYNKIKVLSRKDYGNDSIVYLINNALIKQNSQGIYVKTEQIYKQIVGNLKQPVLSSFPGKDSILYYSDTAHHIDSFVIYNSNDTSYLNKCNLKINSRSLSRNSSLSGGEWYDTLVYQGIGVVISVYRSGFFDNYSQKFAYSIKGNVFCGDSFYYKILSLNPFSIPGSISISPNPASDFLNVKLDENFSYTIYNIQGEKIQEGEHTNSAILLDKISTGLYFIFIQTNKGNYSAKFLKE